jgi:hypothetical protein
VRNFTGPRVIGIDLHRGSQEGDHHQRQGEHLVDPSGESDLRSSRGIRVRARRRRARDEKWVEVPVGILVRKPGSNLTSEQLCDFLQSRIGKYTMPRVIEFSDTPNWKLACRKLHARIEDAIPVEYAMDESAGTQLACISHVG